MEHVYDPEDDEARARKLIHVHTLLPFEFEIVRQ